MTLKKKSNTVKELVENKVAEKAVLTIEQKEAALKAEKDLEYQKRLTTCDGIIQAALKEYGCTQVANFTFSSLNNQPEVTVSTAVIVKQ
jgi:hypothetical protein